MPRIYKQFPSQSEIGFLSFSSPLSPSLSFSLSLFLSLVSLCLFHWSIDWLIFWLFLFRIAFPWSAGIHLRLHFDQTPAPLPLIQSLKCFFFLSIIVSPGCIHFPWTNFKFKNGATWAQCSLEWRLGTEFPSPIPSLSHHYPTHHISYFHAPVGARCCRYWHRVRVTTSSIVCLSFRFQLDGTSKSGFMAVDSALI